MKAQSWNEDWNYRRQGEAAWQRVTLPHDAMIHDLRDPQSPGKDANAYFVGGVYEYEKRFTAPAEWARQHVEVEFGGVYRDSKVYLNGELIAGWPYGYVPFTANLDGALHPGEENVLRVVADNSRLPNSRWYSGGGIYREVRLLTGAKTHIAWKGVQISTLTANKDAEIGVSVSIAGVENSGVAEKAFDVYTEVYDDRGNCAAVVSGCEGTVTVPNARLWSEDIPFLYRYRTSLSRNGEVLDVEEGIFGIRKLSWSNRGLFLNGERILLRGACIHHDNGVLGAAAWPQAEERKIRILKENGYNAVRISHHPASDAFLSACDKLGMYVMDEGFDMWYKSKNPYDYSLDFPEWHLRDLEAMVRQDFNHPSVLLYSIGNEVSEPAEKKGLETAKEMIDFLHRLDGNRAVTGGMNLMIMFLSGRGMGLYDEGGLAAGRDDERNTGKPDAREQVSGSLFFNHMVSTMGKVFNNISNLNAAERAASPVLDLLDIAGYNYAPGRYPKEGKLHPNRVLLGSETYPQDIAKNWAMVEKYPYVVGDFMWTGWDYIGEAGIGAWNYEGTSILNVRYPWLLADAGAIDITGHPGAEAYYAATVWNRAKEPYLGVRPVNQDQKRLMKTAWRGTNAVDSWSWKGCDGREAIVEVYGRGEKAELSLNGEIIGTKRLKDYKAVFRTFYIPGTLSVRILDKNGRETGRKILLSEKGKLQLRLHIEEKAPKAGDLIHLNIEVVGENGVVESNDDRQLKITVEQGELLGFGSARPKTAERFDSGETTAYYGRALAVLRVGNRGLKLKVSGRWLAEEEITLTV